MLTAHHTDDQKRKQARRALREAGISVAHWADENGFSRASVRAVLYGHTKGTRGESHRIAVALGIKDGTVVRARGFVPVRFKKPRLAVVAR